MPASQAGRRRFDPGLPLQFFNDLGTSQSFRRYCDYCDKLPITSRSGWRVLLHPPAKHSIPSRSLNHEEPSNCEDSPKVSLQESALELPYGCQPRFEVALSIFTFVHIDGVTHLSRSGRSVDAGLLAPTGESVRLSLQNIRIDL